MAEDDQDGSGYHADISSDAIEAALKSVEKVESEFHPEKDSEESPAVETAEEEVEVEIEPAEDAEKVAPKDNPFREKMLRLAADYDNYRKRMLKEKKTWTKFGHEAFGKDILPIFDNLERALRHAEGSKDIAAVLEGVEITLKDAKEIMAQHGIKEINPIGETFEPLLHEAMETRATDEAAPNTIVEVHQKGYLLHDRLLRPALVTVAQAQASDKEEGESDG